MKNSIKAVEKEMGIAKYTIPYLPGSAKVSLEILGRKPRVKKYILVTGMNPTPFGEGKTLTALSLSCALKRKRRSVFCTLRQPSLGPLFGAKGTSTGGGRIKVFPEKEIAFGLTGDFANIEYAHNLIASSIDHALYHGYTKLDPNKIWWPRVTQLNDSALRSLVLYHKAKYKRKERFITVSCSELMSIVSLARDEKDLRRRILDISLGRRKKSQKRVSIRELKVSAGVFSLLERVLCPNLVTANNRTPVFMHTGVFANISHGNSSVVADRIAMRLSDYVVSEAGFGTDCGFEKFLHIKAPVLKKYPDVCIVVCSLRALKYHSGKYAVKCSFVDKGIYRQDIGAVEKGFTNLKKHIENVKRSGIPVVVALNKFSSDTKKEIEFLLRLVKNQGVDGACVLDSFAEGERGAYALADAALKIKKTGPIKKFYKRGDSVYKKADKIATSFYGAEKVIFSKTAKEKLKALKVNGFSWFPVCIAKTHLSLSQDSSKRGAPGGFSLTIEDVEIDTGAKFVTLKTKNINLLPGLPRLPRYFKFTVKNDGTIEGVL